MLGMLFRALLVALLVCALAGGLGLVVMAGVAATHDVKPIPIPRKSSLAHLATTWDYADAFRRPMEFSSYRDIHQMMENIPFRADGEIHRTDREVVYAGSLPGLTYQVAYRLDREGFPPAVEIVTVYRFTDSKGKYVWKLFKPVHRCLAPYFLDRLGASAPS
jgi:hypothetical protein